MEASSSDPLATLEALVWEYMTRTEDIVQGNSSSIRELLSKKKKLSDIETIALTEGCSALLTNQLPLKMKGPGSFTIPCSFGNHYLRKALCNLGANINLMPLSTFKKLGIGHMKLAAVTLQLVYRSLAHPEGKIKDILVHVDKFVFPADFIILD
ncbi:uncharacterized protein [Gossypium hirsutum]|uniref:Uncharacterized protein n=1 Tax=Gossypium hirsutum TaxID=3635 RepID=A0ABM3BA10_GOSHI|nr:uncharacterized protein LOC107941821 [Gossypium hirsutum]